METTATHSHAWIHGISEEHAIQTWRRLKDAGALSQDGWGTFEDLTVCEVNLVDGRTDMPFTEISVGNKTLGYRIVHMAEGHEPESHMFGPDPGRRAMIVHTGEVRFGGRRSWWARP